VRFGSINVPITSPTSVTDRVAEPSTALDARRPRIFLSPWLAICARIVVEQGYLVDLLV
jgi:hypothetical protein